MSRSTTVAVDFVAHLSSATTDFQKFIVDRKADWSDFIKFVESNQPTINGVAVAPAGPQSPATTTTFGGLTTVAPRGGVAGTQVNSSALSTAQAVSSVASSFAQELLTRITQSSSSPAPVGPSAQHTARELSDAVSSAVARALTSSPVGTSRPHRSERPVSLDFDSDEPDERYNFRVGFGRAQRPRRARGMRRSEQPAPAEPAIDLQAASREDFDRYSLLGDQEFARRALTDRALSNSARIELFSERAARRRPRADRVPPPAAGEGARPRLLGYTPHADSRQGSERQRWGNWYGDQANAGGGTGGGSGGGENSGSAGSQDPDDNAGGALGTTHAGQRGPSETPPGSGPRMWVPGDSSARGTGWYSRFRAGLNSKFGHFSGGAEDPIGKRLRLLGRTRIIPRWIPGAYEAAGGAVGLGTGYAAYEGYKGLYNDYSAGREYDNAETENVTGDQRTHFENQMRLYASQRGANALTGWFNDPWGTQQAQARATYARADFQDSTQSLHYSQAIGVRSEQAAALAGSPNMASQRAAIVQRYGLQRESLRRSRVKDEDADLGAARDLQDAGEDQQNTYGNTVRRRVAGELSSVTGDRSFTSIVDAGIENSGQGNLRQAAQLSEGIRRRYALLAQRQNAPLNQQEQQELGAIDFQNQQGNRQIRNTAQQTQLSLTDGYGAQRLGIQQDFDLQLDAARRDKNQTLIDALTRGRGAALDTTDARYDRDTGYEARQVGVQSIQDRAEAAAGYHYTYASQQLGIQSQMRQAVLDRDKVLDVTQGKDPTSLAAVSNANRQYASTMERLTAAADAASKDFEAQRTQMAGMNNSRQQALLGNGLTASNLATNAQYDYLFQTDPEHRVQNERSRQLGLQQNQQDDTLRLFGYGLDTKSIENRTQEQNLRNQHLDRTSEVQGIINSTSLEIERVNAEMRGTLPAEVAARRARITGLEGDASSRIAGLIRPEYQTRGTAETSSGYITRGDPNDLRYRDYSSAQQAAAGRTAAFRAAERVDPLAGTSQPAFGDPRILGFGPPDPSGRYPVSPYRVTDGTTASRVLGPPVPDHMTPHGLNVFGPPSPYHVQTLGPAAPGLRTNALGSAVSSPTPGSAAGNAGGGMTSSQAQQMLSYMQQFQPLLQKIAAS